MSKKNKKIQVEEAVANLRQRLAKADGRKNVSIEDTKRRIKEIKSGMNRKPKGQR